MRDLQATRGDNSDTEVVVPGRRPTLLSTLDQTRDTARYVAAGLAFVALSFVCLYLAAEADLEARGRLLRYGSLLALGLLAVAPPHVLLPDPAVPLLQRLNRNPRALFLHQARKWTPLVGICLWPGVLLTFFDPAAPGQALAAKSWPLLGYTLVVLGTGVYSFGRYVAIGPASQAWQEGRRGGWYRAIKAESNVQFAVADGLVPALLATQRVFVVGILALVAAAFADQALARPLVVVPGLVLLGASAWQLWRRLPVYDRLFYATNAFYGEVFRQAGGARMTEREPLPYRAVYWVPPGLRPSVWASLRQLDRKLPLGRYVALGHGIFWILLLQGAGPAMLAAWLLILVIAKNASVYVLTTPALAPSPFQGVLRAPRAWAATRFFVNLRWTLPFLLSLLLAAALHEAFPVWKALGWTGLDVLLAAGMAGLFTYRAEVQHRKRYA